MSPFSNFDAYRDRLQNSLNDLINFFRDSPVTAAIFLIAIIFIVVAWLTESSFLINTAFLLLGGLLPIFATLWIDYNAQKARGTHLARVLHAELADLVARCCYDFEAPWCKVWGPGPLVERFDAVRLRKFAPHRPVTFPTVAGDLAILGENAPLRLIQFQNGLNALRRDIENFAADVTDARLPISEEAIRQIALRMRLTLQPGINALEALAPLVPNASQVEATAIQSYDVTRKEPPPQGTLVDRIKRLLAMPQRSTE